MSKNNSYILFSGTSHSTLAKKIAKILHKDLGKISIETFFDNEIGVQILDNVRGKDVFVIQSIAKEPNHYLMELLIIMDALKRASAKSIVVVMPYFGYARQDRKDKPRVPITAKLIADLLQKAGADRLLTMDLHSGQIQGFFDIPVDNLSAKSLFVEEIKKKNWADLIVVSPDVGNKKLAKLIAEDLHLELAVIDKQRIAKDQVVAKSLIGSVEGKNVVIIDDIVSTGSTLELAAEVCKKNGAHHIYAAVTHGIFVKEKFSKNSLIEELIVTDTISREKSENFLITEISVASFFARAIECVEKSESISSLFR